MLQNHIRPHQSLKKRLVNNFTKTKSRGLLHQLYADDIQAYIHCNAADAVASVGLMCSAIDALSRWMASNRLLLNPSKTQFSWLCWPIPFPMLHSQPRFGTLV